MTRNAAAFVLIFVCALLWGCSHAAAQDGVYTPLQPAMSGQWADPYALGEGFSLVVRDTPAGRMVFGEYFAARACETCPPTWLWFQGTPTPGQSEFTLYASDALTFNTTPTPGATPVGTITLAPLGCRGILAFIDAGPPTLVVRHLAPVVYELGAGQCFTCPAVDFSPPIPQCVG
jgi:hypothetical protein